MKFKIGDKIKLKSYKDYEYPNYKGETATIIDMDCMNLDFDYHIQWGNGDKSYSRHNNTIMAYKTWREKYEVKDE